MPKNNFIFRAFLFAQCGILIYLYFVTETNQPTKNMKKTIKTSLREIFTPSYDMTIDRPYTGNHYDYWVSFFRKGDTVTVNHHGGKGIGPVRPLIKSESHSISSLLAGMIADAQEMGFDYDCDDNLPEGYSLPIM